MRRCSRASRESVESLLDMDALRSRAARASREGGADISTDLTDLQTMLTELRKESAGSRSSMGLNIGGRSFRRSKTKMMLQNAIAEHSDEGSR